MVRLPIDDEHAPADAHLELMVRTMELIHRFRLTDPDRRGVAVHCLHGRGRTGLFLAAYRAFVASRHPAAEARAEVDRLLQRTYGIPITALEADQARWLTRFG